jgi:beta-galactosidase
MPASASAIRTGATPPPAPGFPQVLGAAPAAAAATAVTVTVTVAAPRRSLAGRHPGGPCTRSRARLAVLTVLTVLMRSAALGAADPAGTLIVNGSFAQSGPGIPSGWSCGAGDQRLVSVLEEGGRHFLRLQQATPASCTVEQRFTVDPGWNAVSISVRMRAGAMKRGPEGWNVPCLQYLFSDARNQHIGDYSKRQLDGDAPWTVMTDQVAVPAGATTLAVQCCTFSCSGTFDFADIVAIPLKAGDPPPGQQLASGEAVEELGPRRGRMCLNGLWKFQPALGQAEQQPGPGWGYIRVPGSWTTGNELPGLVSAGLGDSWKGLERNRLGKGWYERPLKVPAAWAGRAVLVTLQRVSTDAVVYLDGAECGRVSWSAGEVDLTAAVKPGTAQVLRVLVVAVQDQAKVLNAMGPGQNTLVDAHLATRGIIGEVFLSSRPKGPHLADVFVRPSTRTGTLGLTVEFVEVAAPGAVALTARILDGTTEVKRFAATVAAGGAPGGAPAEASWPWADAKRWDLAQPQCYTLLLEATGAGIDDAYAQEFGFRECWIEGRTIMLNGTPFRLRPTSSFPEDGVPAVIDSASAGLLGAGFNILELWPVDEGVRGSPTFRDLICERSDHNGLPVMANLLSAAEINDKDSNRWSQPGVKEDWERRMTVAMKHLRNHPSALMWTTTANVFGNRNDQDPRRVGRSLSDPAWSGEPTAWRDHMQRGNDMCSLIARHDPTRPILIHQGGPVSSIYAVNNYLCMIPLQEREEWLSSWAQSGDMPYGAIEFGTPLHVTMNRGRCGFGEAQATEPWMTEFCAIYQGTAAFRSEEPAYRHDIVVKFRKDQEYSGWQGDPGLEHAAAFQELERLFVTNTWRSWRTMGITAGMVPWSDAQGWISWGATQALPPAQPGQRGAWFPQVSLGALHPFQPQGSEILPSGSALVANNSATLAWIAGAGDAADPAAFTSKDHSFRAGDTLRKQVALLNDTRAEQPWTLTVTARVAGQVLATLTRQGRLAVGTTHFEALEILLPAGIAGAGAPGASAPGTTAVGELLLTATIGTVGHADRFPFHVFAPAPAAAAGEVAVVDPDGSATALLTLLGIAARPWTGDAAPVVVVGRGGWSGKAKPPGDLGAYVRNGGRLLLLAQDPEWLRARGLRVAACGSRRVFPVAAGHPVMAGLEAADLCDWNGSSTLVEAHPDDAHREVKSGMDGSAWWGWHFIGNREVLSALEPDDRAHRWGWHWGNRGMVSSAPIEKPHRSGWRPLLECEFDLAYTPLMEADVGKGRMTVCTLDLEDHAARDPAAQRLARNVLAWVRTAPMAPRSTATVYLGGDAGAQLLTGFGLEFTRAGQPPAHAQLIVVGPDRSADDCAEAVRAGARVLVLAHRGTAPGLGITVATRDGFVGSLAPPAWPEAAGLSASDLRWRAEGSAWLAQGGEVGADGLLARVALGTGAMIVCQVDPTLLPADEKTYFRFTRWRQTRALCQLLANGGGTFAADANLLRPEGAPAGDAPSCYHPDYRAEFSLGDDPYRYYRW